MNEITVTVENQPPRLCPEGLEVGKLLPAPAAPDGLPYIVALVNNDVVSLSYPLTVNCTVRFQTRADAHGWRVYRRSLCFLLARVVHELFPEAAFSVEHSFGPGLYCAFNRDPRRPEGIRPEDLGLLAARMEELVRRDVPIRRRKIAFTDAVKQFETSGQYHKLHLLAYRNPPRVVLHECEGFYDLAHGPLVPRTGVLDKFQLLPYPPGFILHLPERANPRELPPFEDQPHLFQIFQEHKEWGRILGVNTVGRLNEIIATGEIAAFIMTAEALHEKKISHIADRIAAGRDRIRVILIAGPSSSGKTTFAKRLTTHLRVNGLRPITLSTDDYFVGLERNPVGPDGQPDFEHLEAVDLELFNRDLLALSEGAEIELPRYDFAQKRRVYKGERLRMEPDQMLIIEGIHGLNPRLTHKVPAERKFKIYISALTQLGIDSNNRISTTDNRLMRRLVRDHTFRGHSPLQTLRLWPAVRQGEKTWIFPFQREADATFNSALDYELAVLKPLVEPLLMQIKPSDPEYAEARRLSEFLLNFIATSERYVPGTSILREYIGHSSFRY